MTFCRSFESSTACSKVNTLPFTGAQKEKSRVEIEEGCQRLEIKLLNLYVP